MSQLPPTTARNAPSDDSTRTNYRAGGTIIDDDLRSRLMWNAVLPPLLISVAAAGAIGYLLLAPTSLTTLTRVLVPSIAGVIALIAILWSVARASSIAHGAHDGLPEIRAMLPRGPEEIQAAVERWQRGDRPVLSEPPARDAGELELLAYEVDRFRTEAVDAVVRASASVSGGQSSGFDVRVGVFVNLARRLQSLVHREIQLLDDLEAQVEDPDLLKGLFAVDHLATRIRRHAENLAVLGGAVSSRQWSKPVNMYVVLRSAVAEVEHYARVKLVRPIDGTLQGHAVADVIHLVAELVENATAFSNPNTQVLLRAQRVTAGIALEVEDRGLGMPREDQNRLNGMLASPDQVDVAELLNDGRIGLYVVSTLARRHGIAVQLQTNIYGGTQAVIVLPPALLGETGVPLMDQAKPEPPRQLEQRQVSASPQAEVKLEQRQVSASPQAEVKLEQRQVSAPSQTETKPSPAPAATPVSPAEVPGQSAEPPAARRPLPYAGRKPGTGGAPTVSPDPRPNTERSPVPAMRAAPEPVSPAPSAASGSQGSSWQSASDGPVPEVGFGASDASSRPSEPGNGNDTTGVIHVGTIPSDDESTQEAPTEGSGKPADPVPGSDTPDPRPRLPQRRRQTHLAPELREAAAPRQERNTEHDPGLMMAFQTGINRAAPAAEDADGRVDGAS